MASAMIQGEERAAIREVRHAFYPDKGVLLIRS
jgi:hypothetical protein